MKPQRGMVSWIRGVMVALTGAIVVAATVLFAAPSVPSEAFFDARYSRNLIVELPLGSDEGPVIVLENVLTVSVGSWEAGTVAGPEFTVNTGELRWVNDAFVSRDRLTLGLHWTSEGSKRAYAMYTF